MSRFLLHILRTVDKYGDLWLNGDSRNECGTKTSRQKGERHVEKKNCARTVCRSACACKPGVRHLHRRDQGQQREGVLDRRNFVSHLQSVLGQAVRGERYESGVRGTRGVGRDGSLRPKYGWRAALGRRLLLRVSWVAHRGRLLFLFAIFSVILKKPQGD